ncbi:unnamed protein product [Mortierella alpina]
MHGLAESKWSKQRSGPQFFSTKVEPPTAPAETVFDSASASAQMTFSSSRVTLREPEDGHPSSRLATSAGSPGSQPHPNPGTSSNQGAAEKAPARTPVARPAQESTAAPQPPQSPSSAPGAPPKANGGNPWAAFAMAADPEGQAQDGRSYVGGRSYIVDKPAATAASRNPPSKPFPPLQNKPQKSQITSQKPFPQPPNNASQKPGPPSAGSGWLSSPSTAVGQQSWPQASQSQNNTNQRSRPTSATSGLNSSSSTSTNQQSWPQTPRSGVRPPAENRWAGRPLATTAMFTDDFFSTAKPRSQASSTASLSSATDRPNQARPSSSNGWTDQSNMNNNNNFTPKQDFSTNAHTRPGFSTGSEPAPATAPKSWRDFKQQQDSQPQMYEQQQEQGHVQQEQEQAQEQRKSVQEQQSSQRQPQQPSQSSQSPAPQSYQPQNRGGPINGHKKQPSNAWPDEDGGNTTSHHPSAMNSESGRTSRMDAVSDMPDDPLFLQYPIGDGCHVVVAMYVERTAEAAASRFPTMTRKRQESSWKQKSVEEVTTIFKQALTDEKRDVTG